MFEAQFGSSNARNLAFATTELPDDLEAWAAEGA